MAWSGQRIRQTFIDFFTQQNGHTFQPSSPVVPHDDKTLLFTNAGMNQFKAIFLEQVEPTSHLYGLKSAANTQKCIRAGGKHNDLDDVGKDTYHHTFFEMLGNWSFGDYFKREAIDYAWKLLTEVYGLDKDRIYVTYFGGHEKSGLAVDEEARAIWREYLPEERVLPFGMKDNFWEMGETGPCGPCSEIHYDRIGNRDARELVNADVADVIEIWNLVFMQFNRLPSQELAPLPNKHVDTGMGFERLASILQGKDSNYDTDIFTPIFEAIQQVTGFEDPYSGKVGEDDVNGADMAYRVVADHIRTLCFALTDGALPGPKDRGYVLRRIVRRGVRYGKRFLGAPPDFFQQLVPVVIELMGPTFPELTRDGVLQNLQEILSTEEASFLKTLDRGEKIFCEYVEVLKGNDETQLTGDQMHKLKDTFGFPPDLTALMAEEEGLTVDKERFKELEKIAQERSRRNRKGGDDEFELEIDQTAELTSSNTNPTDFFGCYAWKNISDAKIKSIYSRTIEERKLIDGDGKEETIKESTYRKEESLAASDDLVGIVLDKTSFYPEAGGQITDTGSIIGDGFEMCVIKCKSFAGYVLHTGKIISGELQQGATVETRVDYERRRRIVPNHTFTHVMNHSLRDVCGKGIEQKGSYVGPDKLTFDFNFKGKIPAQKLRAIQEQTQKKIEEGLDVYTDVIALPDALSVFGLRAVFGETYPNPVRVVSIGKEVNLLTLDPNQEDWYKYSVELCGGTHLSNTREAESFALISEGSVSLGIRRITAYTGKDAAEALSKGQELLQNIKNISEIDFTIDGSQSSFDDTKIVALATCKQRLGDFRQGLSKQTVPEVDKSDIKEIEKSIEHQIKDTEKQIVAINARTVGEKVDEIMEEKSNLINVSDDAKCIVFRADRVGLSPVADAVKAGCEKLSEAFPECPVMVVSGNPHVKKKGIVIVYGIVPKSFRDSYKMKAGDWVKHVSKVVGGGGGGKPHAAQGQGRNIQKIDEALEESVTFLKTKVNQ